MALNYFCCDRHIFGLCQTFVRSGIANEFSKTSDYIICCEDHDRCVLAMR